VYVTSNGQLGVLASSERYKTRVTSLGDTSDKLSQLRPVSYVLKNDPSSGVQFGLIAEEVDKVIPELVIRDEAGKVQGVRYDELAPMLLQQVQQQHAQLQKQQDEIATLKQQTSEIAALKTQMVKMQALTDTLRTALGDAQAKSAKVAMR
jgi:hypothetical protein